MNFPDLTTSWMRELIPSPAFAFLFCESKKEVSPSRKMPPCSAADVKRRHYTGITMTHGRCKARQTNAEAPPPGPRILTF